MSRWWRAYDEAVDDPKLCLLTDKQHRAWFNVCCITSQNGGKLPPMAAVAFKLRMAVEKAKAMIAELVALGLVDLNETGAAAPHNWGKRQFQSDVSTERVKRFRNGERNVSETANETPPETEQKQSTEQISELRSESSGRKPDRYPEDFEKQFWKPYPRTPVMSKKEAVSAWRKLSDDDRIRAVSAVAPYRKFLTEKPDHAVVHACRFLSQRRFDGLAESVEPTTTGPPQPPDPSLPSHEEMLKRYANGRPTSSGSSGEISPAGGGLSQEPSGRDAHDYQARKSGMASMGAVLSRIPRVRTGGDAADQHRPESGQGDDGPDPVARVV